MTAARFAILAGLWNKLPPWERRLLAADPLTPPDVLAGLARDTDFEVRERVARNLSTPIDALEGLTRDSNPGVSAAARATITALQGEGQC